MVKKVLFVFLIVSCVNIFAEVDLDATLSGAITSTFQEGSDATISQVASGSLSIQSEGQRDVKSQLLIDFTSVRSLGVVSITKAWIKFRYPAFRVTLGKNRITWGEGAAFNAGDVIFDDYISPTGSGDDIDLTADELKSLNRTLAQVTFPLGRFTYLEGIYLPYDFFTTLDMASIAGGSYPDDLDYSVHSFGGRFVTRAAGVKIETGYIYNGSSEFYKPYLSFEGNLGVDYHISSSVNIESNNTDFDDFKESWKISTGLFYMFQFESESFDRTLSLRGEALINPFKDWESDALLLYPEVAFVPNQELSLFSRAIINPLEFNLEGTVGLNWKTYQGFSIGSFLSATLDNTEDPVGSLTITVTHKF